MKIAIDIAKEDAALVDGFCLATGYSDKSGLTKADWIGRQAKQFIESNGKTGYMVSSTKTQSDALIAARKTALESSKSALTTADVTVTSP